MPLLREAGTFGYFAHIPKCGGTSIIQALKNGKTNIFFHRFFQDGKREDWANVLIPREEAWIPPNDRPCSNHHWHSDIVKLFVNVKVLNFTFAMWRDPVDRMFSEYRFRRKAYAKLEQYSDWRKYDLGTYEHDQISDDFGYWLRKARDICVLNPFAWDNHFRPQSEFLLPNMKLVMYPNFEGICDVIQSHLSYRPNIPWINKSEDSFQEIKKEDRQFIEEWYNSDYEVIENKKDYNWI